MRADGNWENIGGMK
ncbi:hypothetical protein [Escherichia coli]|nr:hypothetical protein [Escherichia coli]